MKDKVQKIREGIEKLKSQLLRGACSSQIAMETMCKEEAYNEVLSILDTMQKEPKKCMYTNEHYTDDDRKVLCEDCEERCEYSKKEEPVSEFLNTESMIESYKQRLISKANGMKKSPFIDMCLVSYKHGINETLNTLNLSNVERTVKNWKEEPVSDDLEEAAWLYYDKNRLPIPPEWDLHKEFIDFFKAGAEWHKEQMMSKAIDVEVKVDAGGYPYILQMELYDYDKDIPLAKEGDKYKVVLIKEE